MSRPRYDLLRLVVIASILPLLGILLAGYLDYSAPVGIWITYHRSEHLSTARYFRVHSDDDANALRDAIAAQAEYITQLKAEIKQLREELVKWRPEGATIVVTNGHNSITLSTPQAIRTPLDDCKAALADMSKERDALSAASLAGQVEHEQRALDECERCQEMQRRGFLLLCVDCGGKRAALDEAKKHVVARAGSCMAQLANVTAQLANMTKERDVWKLTPREAADAEVREREEALKRCRATGTPLPCSPGVVIDARLGFMWAECPHCIREEQELKSAKERRAALDSCPLALANMTAERDAWRRRAPLDAAVAKVEQREQELKRCRGPTPPTLGNCVVTGIKPDRYGRDTEYHCFGCDAEEDNLDAAKKQLLAANACAADLDECRATQLAYDKEYYALAEACGMVDKAVHVARKLGTWASDVFDSVTKSKP